MSRWRRPDAAQVAAFEDFARHRAPALTALSRALSASDADAQDLLQETLVRVLERWEQVDAAHDPYAYVRRAMVNTATTIWRRGHRDRHASSADDLLERSASAAPLWSGAAQHDGGLVAVEERAVLLDAVRSLPARQRTVVVLRYLEELPDAQIAALMGTTSGTVRSTCLRALRTLRVGGPDT